MVTEGKGRSFSEVFELEIPCLVGKVGTIHRRALKGGEGEEGFDRGGRTAQT